MTLPNKYEHVKVPPKISAKQSSDDKLSLVFVVMVVGFQVKNRVLKNLCFHLKHAFSVIMYCNFDVDIFVDLLKRLQKIISPIIVLPPHFTSHDLFGCV